MDFERQKRWIKGERQIPFLGNTFLKKCFLSGIAQRRGGGEVIWAMPEKKKKTFFFSGGVPLSRPAGEFFLHVARRIDHFCPSLTRLNEI